MCNLTVHWSKYRLNTVYIISDGTVRLSAPIKVRQYDYIDQGCMNRQVRVLIGASWGEILWVSLVLV